VRRFIVVGAVVLLVLAAAVPLTNASATPVTTAVTKHVDGSVVVWEPTDGGRTWLSRFEVRTTPSGTVDFGYFELYGISGDVMGQIHEFSVYHVDYYRTPSRAQGATLSMTECVIIPPTPCFPSPHQVSDGSMVGQGDTLMSQLGWVVQSGNVSIYTTSDQNSQWQAVGSPCAASSSEEGHGTESTPRGATAPGLHTGCSAPASTSPDAEAGMRRAPGSPGARRCPQQRLPAQGPRPPPSEPRLVSTPCGSSWSVSLKCGCSRGDLEVAAAHAIDGDDRLH